VPVDGRGATASGDNTSTQDNPDGADPVAEMGEQATNVGLPDQSPTDDDHSGDSGGDAGNGLGSDPDGAAIAPADVTSDSDPGPKPGTLPPTAVGGAVSEIPNQEVKLSRPVSIARETDPGEDQGGGQTADARDLASGSQIVGTQTASPREGTGDNGRTDTSPRPQPGADPDIAGDGNGSGSGSGRPVHPGEEPTGSEGRLNAGGRDSSAAGDGQGPTRDVGRLPGLAGREHASNPANGSSDLRPSEVHAAPVHALAEGEVNHARAAAGTENYQFSAAAPSEIKPQYAPRSGAQALPFLAPPLLMAGAVDEVDTFTDAARAETGTVLGQASVRPAVEALAVLTPQVADLLDGFVPFDLRALETAMQKFLDQVEDLGGDAAGWIARMNLSPWIVAAAVGLAACDVARRKREQSRRGLALAGGEAATLTWSPGLAGVWSVEEA
jgi:hypothetical protein